MEQCWLSSANPCCFLGFPFAASIFWFVKGVPGCWHAPACFATSCFVSVWIQASRVYGMRLTFLPSWEILGRAGWEEARSQPVLANPARCGSHPGWRCGFVVHLPEQELSSPLCQCLSGGDRWSDPGTGQLCCVLLPVMGAVVKQGRRHRGSGGAETVI